MPFVRLGCGRACRCESYDAASGELGVVIVDLDFISRSPGITVSARTDIDSRIAPHWNLELAFENKVLEFAPVKNPSVVTSIEGEHIAVAGYSPWRFTSNSPTVEGVPVVQ